MVISYVVKVTKLQVSDNPQVVLTMIVLNDRTKCYIFYSPFIHQTLNISYQLSHTIQILLHYVNSLSVEEWSQVKYLLKYLVDGTQFQNFILIYPVS